MNNQADYVSLNGRILPAGSAAVYPGQAGMYYGAGCFETFRANQTEIFAFKDHIRRLKNGLLYLGVPEKRIPEENFIREEILELLEKAGLDRSAARVRVQVSLDERRGYHPAENPALIRFITVSGLTQPPSSISLATVNTRVVPSVCKPAVYKTCNMLHYRNAFREAKKKGADDGLLLTVNDCVAETSVANIFWKRGNEVYTPSEECDILPGIIRAVLLKLLEEMDISVHQDTFTRKDIDGADLIWVTNSVSEITPVRRLDGVNFPDGNSFLTDLRNKLGDVKSDRFS